MKQRAKKKPASTLGKKPRAKKAAVPADTRWQTCSICKTIPARSRAFWKGGERQENGWASAASKLIIIGAPFMDDDTGLSNACLKQCPECGDYYAWEFSRKYSGAGSEEEILLTRLSKTAGEKRARAIFKAIEAYQAQFVKEAPSHIDTLLHAGDVGHIQAAALFLSRHQQKDCDIAFALPALVRALARIDGKSDAAGTMREVIHSFGSQGRQNLQIILDLLQDEGMDADDPKINSAIVSCKQELRSKDESPHADGREPKPIGANHPAILTDWFLESVSYQSKFGGEDQEEKPVQLPCGVCASQATRQVYEYLIESQWCRSETIVEVHCLGCGAYSVYLNPGY